VAEFVMYHNPRCSKSRETLALLRERGVEPRLVLYLDTPPTFDELDALLAKLGLEPAAVMRRGEKPFAELGLGDGAKSRAALIAAIVAHPVLLERPIVLNGDRAVLGRPPERVLDLL
jgi:arsenate reductase